jgi:aspartate-semialdehyde dehydrogenase
MMALIGGQTLLGREIRDLARDYRVVAMDTQDAEGQTLVRGGAEDDLEIMPPLDAKTIREADVVVLAGDAASAAKAMQMGGRRVIDASGGLAGKAFRVLRAPLAEGKAGRMGAVVEVAHPAAVLLGVLVKGLTRKPVRMVATVLVPASEFGTAAITELQQQTVNLLSFKALPKAVFDAQAAFALLAELGDEAPAKLEGLRARVVEQVQALVPDVAVSLMLAQAPVFHGLSAAVWMEFESRVEVEGLVAGENVDVRGADLEPPNNVQTAGQDGIAVGGIRAEGERAVWLWVAADNHRLTAANVMALAAEGGS